MPLTEKQQADLNAAVLDYLSQQGYAQAAEAFQAEVGHVFARGFSTVSTVSTASSPQMPFIRFGLCT